MWKTIPGFPDYEASEAGQVRNGATGRILPLSMHGRNRPYVSVRSAEGKWRKVQLQRLILMAHVGEPDDGAWGLHKDDDPLNNHVSNLYWGTPSQNSHDAVRNGGHTQSRKRACELGHLLIEPNLVPSSSKAGGRGCLACKRTQSAHFNDSIRMPTRYNRGADGFRRQAGETFRQESDRRYAHIMRDTDRT